VNVMDSVNIGTVTLNKRAKARSIGSPEYEDLKLRKEGRNQGPKALKYRRR
jgi:hypothetical protein